MSEQLTPFADYNIPSLSPAPASAEILLSGPVQAVWHGRKPGHKTDEEEPEVWVDLELPGASPYEVGFSGSILTDYAGTRYMSADTVKVTPELEGNHLGQKLVTALGYEAVRADCSEIEVDFLHPASLKAFIKVFGFERIHFYGHDEELLTEEGAIQTVTERWGKPKGPYRQKLRDLPSTLAAVDLAGLDVIDWEAPIESDVLPGIHY